MRAHTVLDGPIGPMTVVAESGALVGLYMENQKYRPDPATFGREDAAVLDTVRQQLEEYFAGERTTFDLPLAPRGTEFQQRVWTALREIPFGETTTYGELARSIGRPTASRAVGAANGRNPISIVVPCHRVLGCTGKLTGYAGGMGRKRHLLALEQRNRPSLTQH